MASQGFLEEIVEAFQIFKNERRGADPSVEEHLFTYVELPYNTYLSIGEDFERFEPEEERPVMHIVQLDGGVRVVQLDVFDARIVNGKLQAYARPLDLNCEPLEIFRGWYPVNEAQAERVCMEVYEMIEQNREMLE